MSNDIYMIINMIFLVYYVYKLMIIVCLTCNITLPRRRGSRPDGTRYISDWIMKYSIVLYYTIASVLHVLCCSMLNFTVLFCTILYSGTKQVLYCMVILYCISSYHLDRYHVYTVDHFPFHFRIFLISKSRHLVCIYV